jgi:cutinase
MGSVVGPPLATAMQATFGADKVAVQGVDYPANFAGATTGATNPKNAAGAKNMVAMVAKVAAACPDSKVVLSGYSQGAEQVRGALMNMPAGGAMMAKVAERLTLPPSLAISYSLVLEFPSFAPANIIQAAVTFGDPLQADQFANIDQAKTKVNCAQGDQVCNEQFLISAAHLSYGKNGNVEESVAFVKGVMGM